MKSVTIRCRFYVQAGRHEKHVYECSIAAGVSLRDMDRALTGESDVLHSMLEHAVCNLLKTLPEATVLGSPLLEAMTDSASEVLMRDLREDGNPF